MHVYNSSYKEASSLSPSSSSSQQQLSKPKTPPQPPPPPPANYRPTGYEYNFVNFGLPHYVGNYQYYTLIDPIDWMPQSPSTLILTMTNFHVIKVGLAPNENSHINSIAYEMHRAMSPLQQGIDIDYVTHNSLLYMKIDERTNVQLLRDQYVTMQPTACLTRWPTSTLKAVSMRVKIEGFRRCCGRLELTFHVKSLMIEDCDDEGYSDIITLL